MSAPPVVLRAEDITVEYEGAPPTRAVRHASLTLHRGELVGIAGESGCGKSTLAYAVTQMLKPPARMTAGRVVLADADGAESDLAELGDDELRRLRWQAMSIVFQSAMNALNPVTRISRQFDDIFKAHRPLMTRGQRRERACDLLALVGIEPSRVDSYAHELSGGMRQRIVIAMALALDPQIVIMDEPTTALDVVVQREILDEITRLREQLHFAVVFITHDMSLLLEISDRLLIMYAGEIVESAPTASIAQAPAHPYTLGLVESFPDLVSERRELRGIPGTPPDLRRDIAGCPFAPRCRFRFEPCDSIKPELVKVGPGEVACHLHDRALRPQGPPEELIREASA